MHLVSPAKTGWARPVLSPQQYACALHTHGKPLAGCLGAQSATMQPVDSQTVRAPQHSRSQQLHHLALHVCIIWAAPPRVDSST